MHYRKIINPENGKLTRVNSKKGRKILKEYILQANLIKEEEEYNKNIQREEIFKNIKKNIIHTQLNEKNKIGLISLLKTNISVIENFLDNISKINLIS